MKKRLKYVYDEDDFYDDWDDDEDDYMPSNLTTKTKKAVKTAKKTNIPDQREYKSVKKDFAKLSIKETEHIAKIKPTRSFIFLGHVDTGKSTLLGRLLCELGYFQLPNSSEAAKGTCFSSLLDVTETEKTRGVTIDINVKFVETEKFLLKLIDAPGHRDFIPNLIQGLAQSEGAVLLVPASTQDFSKTFENNAQTKEHTLLLRYLGIKKLIVAVNKIDSTQYSEAEYNEVVSRMKRFIARAKFDKIVDITFLPTSGLKGINLTKKASAQPSWYHGKTLLQLIQFDGCAPNISSSETLRVGIQTIKNNGTLDGTIISGTLRQNQAVRIYPENIKTKVKKIVTLGERVEIAIPPTNVTLTLSNVDADSFCKSSIIVPDNYKIPTSNKILVSIITLESLTNPIILGSPFLLFLFNNSVSCEVEKLHSCRELEKDGATTVKNPRFVERHHTAIISLKLSSNICYEKYAECHSLGRVVLRQEAYTVAAGIIL